MKTETKFWTPNREKRVVMWFYRFKDKEHTFDRVAAKLKTSKDAVYKKLGRLGHLNAEWSKKYSKK